PATHRDHRRLLLADRTHAGGGVSVIPGSAARAGECMSETIPFASRPTLVSLLRSGDEIALPIQRNGVGPVEYHRATITALEDDEENRHVRMTLYMPSLDSAATNGVKPGDL